MANINLTKVDNTTNVALNKGATKDQLDSAVSDVIDYRDECAESASQAANSATTASTKATEASSSATTAATYLSQVQSNANAAAASAAAALVSEQAAQSSEDDAETAQQAAEAAQTAAETAETNAELAETNAETAQTAAESAQTSAESAQTSAETAQSAAESAQASAESSAASATASATSAASSATDAQSSEDDAEISAIAAANSATASASSATSASASATTATTQADIATAQATNSANSASASATSASNAATSESNAATSENNAATSATQASNSATEASGYATTAGTYDATYQSYLSDTEDARDAAQLAQTGAETAETNASTYASNASVSASNASTSETNASNSASAAATSATNASTSETNADNSATSASGSASTATTQAGIATTKASEASTSAANALTSENNSSDSEDAASASATAAALSASSASTSASNASTSATNASNSATSAASSASSASSSASTATTQASNAASSANAAGTAQLAAESARDAALEAYDNFDDRYLGAKATEPTVDNDGNPLVAGTLFFDTTAEHMKLYTGSEWVSAYVSADGVLLAANNLNDLADASTARSNLGLGSAATTDSDAYEPADSTILKDADIGVTVQGYDANIVSDASYNHITVTSSSVSDGTNTFNKYTLPSDVVQDASYVHTDNNYTTTEKTKLSNIEDNANNYTLPSDVVQDASYVHTDNNYTTTEKNKLAGIESGATGDQTASEILTAIKTVDGSGSGLDADTVDGLQASQFLRSDASFTYTEGKQASFRSANAIESTSGDQASLEIYQDNANEDAFMQFHVAGDYAAYFGLDGSDNQFKVGGWSMGANKYKVWHAGNDGSGSGLDADTLDGVQGSDYVRATGDQNIDGVKTFMGSHLAIENPTNTWKYLRLRSGSATKWDIASKEDDTGGALQFRPGGGNANTAFVTTGGYFASDTQGTLWGSSNDGSGSGLDADTVDGVHASSFLRSDATDYLTGTIYFRGDMVGGDDGYRDHGVYGNYDSYKTDHIWSMGTSYRNSSTGANFGNLYGLAYKHTHNSTGGTMGGGHQMVWCTNGTPRGSIGESGIWSSGNVTAYSDKRVKTNLEVIPNALEKVSKINGYTYDRTDIEYDEETGLPNMAIRQSGVVAQEILEVLPEVVTGGPTDEDPEGHYSVAYGNMVGLLIEAIKELKAEIEELKKDK